MNDIMELWVTPPTDVLHLNYDESYNDGWFTTSGNPLPLLVWLVRREPPFHANVYCRVTSAGV